MKKEKFKILCFTGLSGSGKTTLSNKVLEKYSNKFKLSKIITYTTRTPRPGEKEGIDYFFIKKCEFEKLTEKDFFLETKNYDNNFYGTSKKDFLDLNENKILVSDIRGAIEIQEKFENTIVFLVTCENETLNKRLEKQRLNYKKRIEQNLADAELTTGLKTFTELENNNLQDIEQNLQLIFSCLTEN